MKKEVVKRWAGFSLVTVVIIGLLAAGISAEKQKRHDRRVTRADAALARLVSEWKDLKKERLVARWHRELLKARGRAVDARLSLDADKQRTGRSSGPDSLLATMLRAADRDVSNIERSLEQAPKVCDAAIDKVRQQLYEAAKVRAEAMKAAGAQEPEGQFAFLSRSPMDLSQRFYERKVHDALRGSPWVVNADADPLRCAEWYETVYSDNDPSSAEWYTLQERADAEAEDGVVRHYTVEDARRPQRWELGA
jgi:hypothetical protein